MSGNIYNPGGKDIRFIDSRYNELFKIPDGGYITITHESGEQAVRQCRYHGECHVDIGSNVYHICEFAGIMEKNGSAYKPCPEPEIVRGYRITDRMSAGDNVFVLAHNPDAARPWVTWHGKRDRPGYGRGHYWSDRSVARSDYFLRAAAGRTEKPHDRTKLYKQPESRNGAR